MTARGNLRQEWDDGERFGFDADPNIDEHPMTMDNQSEQLEFSGSQGTTLAARLDLPDSAPRAYAVFAHCFTCSKDVLAATRISRASSTRFSRPSTGDAYSVMSISLSRLASIATRTDSSSPSGAGESTVSTESA